jgi:hypothetical protein
MRTTAKNGRASVIYRRGNLGIGIGNLPKNKRKCLYIQEGVCIRKVATFCNDEEADIFGNALKYLLGLKDKEDKTE